MFVNFTKQQQWIAVFSPQNLIEISLLFKDILTFLKSNSLTEMSTSYFHQLDPDHSCYEILYMNHFQHKNLCYLLADLSFVSSSLLISNENVTALQLVLWLQLRNHY